MAHRELQGRMKLANQQIHIYRDTIQQLIAVPRNRGLQDTSTPSAISSRERTSDHWGELSPGGTQSVALQPMGDERARERGRSGPLNQDRNACASERTATIATDVDQERTDSAPPISYDPQPNKILGFFGGTTGRRGGEMADWMAQSGTSSECHQLRQEIHKLMSKRIAVMRQRELVARSRAELTRCQEELLSRGIAGDTKRSDLAEAKENCRTRQAFYSEQLVRAMNMGALNDSFLIWQQGPFATINGFRLGRLDAHLVDWQEVNAGVGQAAIILVTVAMAMGVEFTKYLIAPCGSFSKIARSEDGRVLYSLHTDESFSLFPRRNFNLALKAFLHCLGEVGDHVQEHDPTLRLPYHIREKEGTVGGLPVALGGSLEDWTRALKYMITDLKWVAAWAAKYLPPC